MRKTLLIISLIISHILMAQNNEKNSEQKKIVVLGSSVAAGWVTSYQEKYDFKNGYLWHLKRQIEDEGFQVINKSIPGDNTITALKKFDEDILSENPDFVYIGLSLSNEGLSENRPDSVVMQFEAGIQKIIEKCEEHNIKAILGSCYANNDYTIEEFDFVKRMNIKLNGFQLPMVNLLGSFTNKQGHFPGENYFDNDHPNDTGHEELFLSFPPGFFKKISQNKEVPKLINHESFLRFGPTEETNELHIYPQSLMHSFSLCFEISNLSKGELIEIKTLGKNIKATYDKKDLEFMYGNEKKIRIKLNNAQWNKILIQQSYLDKNIEVYLNSQLLFTIKDQIEPIAFIIGKKESQGKIRNLYLYRAALNEDEIKYMNQNLYHASLEYYVPFNNGDLENYALSSSVLYPDPENVDQLFSNSLQNIEDAQIARDNSLKIEPKIPIKMDPSEYKKYAGKYILEGEDYFLVEVENDKIFFNDRGNKAEIFPESENSFFLHYPGDITFTFSEENGNHFLIANFNGFKLKAKKTK